MSLTTVHIVWGELASSLYRRGVIDNTVRLAHAVYDFSSPQEAASFLYGISEARKVHEWAHVTRLPDQKALGMPPRSRLIAAILKGDLDEVSKMLDMGVSPQTRAPNGMNALQIAAREGQGDIAKVLLERGAPAEEPSDSLNPHSAMHLAAASPKPGASQVIALLAERSADLDRIDREGKTALERALEHGRTHQAAALLKNGARPDIPNDAGKTARTLFNERFGAVTQDEGVDALETALDESEHHRVAELARVKALSRHARPRPTPYSS